MAQKSDVFLEVFQTNDIDKERVVLEEGLFKLSPFLAVASLKNKFTRGADSLLAKVTLRKKVADIKAKALTFKEKVRAEFGIDTKNEKGDSASYRLSKEQMQVMIDIYEKYGDEIVDKIVAFRRDVLAPYTLMKRMIRKNTNVSSRDVFGLSKEEYMSALESGKKKIELRGGYIEQGNKSFEKMGDIESKIQRLREAKKSLQDKGALDENILEKLYQKFNVHKDTFSKYSLSSLESYVSSLNRSFEKIERRSNKGLDTSQEILDYRGIEKNPDEVMKKKDAAGGDQAEKAIDIYFGKIKKVIAPHNKFNDALTSYFMRKNIHDEIKRESTSVYREIYGDIIDGMLLKYENLKKDYFSGVLKNRKGIYFNEVEDKIFKLKPNTPFMSGKMADYDIKIKPEDFLERPIYIKKSPELEAAEKKAEEEVKRFENQLKEILDPEDFSKLKKYRLIGNVVTIKEMKDANSMFKSPQEIRTDIMKHDDGDNEEEQEDNDKKIGEEEFVAHLNKVISKDYSSLSELMSDKHKIEDMVKRIRLNNDDAIIQDNEALLRRARGRTETKEADKEHMSAEIVSVKDIEEFVKKILEKNYTSYDDLKYDRDKLKEMEEKFKDKSPDDSDNEDIDFMVQKANYKFKKYAFGVEGGLD